MFWRTPNLTKQDQGVIFGQESPYQSRLMNDLAAEGKRIDRWLNELCGAFGFARLIDTEKALKEFNTLYGYTDGRMERV